MSEAAKTRIQIDLFAAELERMNVVMHMSGSTTRKDLLNNALTLFYWAATEVAKGNRIGALKPDGSFIELTMPALMNAQSYGLKENVQQVSRSLEPSLKEAAGHDAGKAPEPAPALRYRTM